MKLKELEVLLATVETLSKQGDLETHDAITFSRHVLKRDIALAHSRRAHCQNLNKIREVTSEC